MLCGAAQLRLGRQLIPVRLVVNTGNDASILLERLRHEILCEFAPEHFVVMAGFAPGAVAAYQDRFKTHSISRVTVGTPNDYLTWLKTRLGPLSRVALDSPLRSLAEHLRCVLAAPEPTEKRALVGDYRGSKIEPQFLLGALGVQAIETLLAFTRGSDAVENVEADLAFREVDVDLLVKGSWLGKSGLKCRRLRCEVKNENFRTRNIALEIVSSIEGKTKGWFEYSEADVLISVLWPTGDVFLMDLPRLRKWVAANARRLGFPEQTCTVPQQSYHSLCWIVPVNVLLNEDFIVHLRLGHWLPSLYAGQFEAVSQVFPKLAHKTMLPQRIDWPHLEASGYAVN
jgi:hypothetical protein